MIKPRRKKWAVHVACMGAMRNAFNILVGKFQGKRTLGRNRRRLKDNIRMDLREIGWEGVDWILLAEDTDLWRDFVNFVMNICVP
jgi:hypothetical protein